MMQPPCSLLQLGPCGPSPSLGETQGGAVSFQRLEEKELFEKFWKGTFKAVATPRPGSVIVASITACRRVANTETPTACQPLKPDERKVEDAGARPGAADRHGCIKAKGCKHNSHRRVRSPSYDEDISPRPTPKGKKKKRKSERKRKRKRSPSHSLSPPRKKKKKKKKSSKKSKRHRYTSKKSKHSSSSLKHKRKDERKHKKSYSRHRRRRYRRSESEASSWDSYTESRHHLQKSVAQQAFRELAGLGEDSSAVLDQRDLDWRPAPKSVCKTAPKYRSILSTGTTLSSKPGDQLMHGKGAHRHTLSRQADAGPHDYDSGNDTSSPPSSKTGVSQASVTEDKRSHCHGLASPEKQKLTYRDNASDSGNSVTSYASLCKPHAQDGLSASLFSGKREQITLGCQVEVVRPQKTSVCLRRTHRRSRRRRKARRSRSRSTSHSSGSSRHSGRYSRSPSLSSRSSYYSRSPTYSPDARRRGSVASASSRGSYSRYSPDRQRDRKRAHSSRERDTKHKNGRKRHRRKSYSPMKKRRRDSPSHLEARRITSARKRPIPYFRPSPSSSSRSTSVSSWSSLFTRSRSRSRSSLHSSSRSRSSSSYRSYSRSSSWNSIFGTRSRSRSRSSVILNKRSKARH